MMTNTGMDVGKGEYLFPTGRSAYAPSTVKISEEGPQHAMKISTT